MRRAIPHRRELRTAAMVLLALIMTTACSDDLFEQLYQEGQQGDGDICLSLTLSEQNDLRTSIGGTRAATAPTEVNLHELPGLADGLKVGGQPLPLIGIHQRSTTSGEARTRGIAADDWNGVATTKHFHDSLTLYGYTDKRDLHTTGIRGLTVKKIRNWRTSLHWPYSSDYMQFFAISPAIENVEGIHIIYKDNVKNGKYTTDASGAPTFQPVHFRYQVPNDLAEQRDLLYGTSEIIDIKKGPQGDGTADTTKTKKDNLGKDNKEVKLPFQHILTAVRFAQGKIPTHLRIKKIELTRIANYRTFNGTSWELPKNNEGTGYLTDDQTHSGNYVLNLDYTPTAYDCTGGGENVYIDGGQVMFLMPHTLTSDAQMEITLDDITDPDKPKEHKVKTSLTGDNWQQGYTFTYVITIGKISADYYLKVDKDYTYVKFATSDQTASFTVHSYQLYHDYAQGDASDNTYSDNTEEDGNKLYKAVNWHVAGFSKDGKEDEYSLENISTRFPWIQETSVSRGDSQTGRRTLNGQIILNAQNWVDDHATTGLTWLSTEENLKAGYSHKRNLLDFTQASTADWEDLSLTRGGVKLDNEERETANSYIIRRAGTYLIPLVYGNAIQNGTERTLDNSNFVDHRGVKITHAWLEDQLAEDNNDGVHFEFPNEKEEFEKLADVLWIDQNDGTGVVIDYVQLTKKDEKLYLQFSVGGTLQPANILFAVYAHKYTKNTDGETYKDDGKYEYPVWSWHVWLTDEVYGKDGKLITTPLYSAYTSTTENTIAEKLMPANLGWIPKEDRYGHYEPRQVWVKLTQDTPTADADLKPEDVTFCIRQWADQDLLEGGNTIYQWGRPVALPMVADVTTDEGESKTIFKVGTDPNQPSARRHVMAGKSTTVFFDLITKKITSRQEAIRLPSNLVWKDGTDKKMWWGQDERDLWGGGTSGTTTKTLYDPCPPGFCVPHSSFFVYRLGGETGKGDNMNNKSRIGANLYTTPYPEGGRKTDDTNKINNIWNYRADPTAYFPATGRWSSGAADSQNVLYIEGGTDNNLLDDPSKGFWWTSNYKHSSNVTQGTYLYINPGSDNTLQILTDKTAAQGLSLRPMVEGEAQ